MLSISGSRIKAVASVTVVSAKGAEEGEGGGCEEEEKEEEEEEGGGLKGRDTNETS